MDQIGSELESMGDIFLKSLARTAKDQEESSKPGFAHPVSNTPVHLHDTTSVSTDPGKYSILCTI